MKAVLGNLPACLLLLAATLSTSAASPAARSSAIPATDELARRLCDSIQTLPDARKAQCCGTSPNGGLAAICTRELGRALRDDTLALAPSDVDRCVAESERTLDGCDWVTPYAPRIPASCDGIVHGRLDAGARCRSSIECRDGLSCRGGGPTIPGVCAPPGKPGAACSGVPDPLATYVRQTDDARHPECAGFCVLGRCAAVASAGGTCSSDRQCGPGSHCASRRCVDGPRPALGAECEGSICESGLACLEGRCALPKKAGEPCTKPTDCQATCLTPAPGERGTCGMKCSAWPPAGYTPPVDASLAVGATPHR